MPLRPAPFYDQAFLERVTADAERKGSKEAPFFFFGDNLEKWGKGGQAKHLRGNRQAIGIDTKTSPRQGLEEQIWPEWRDTFEESWRKNFSLAEEALKRGADVWWPVDGIGTGLASLPSDCPSGWKALCAHTRALFAFDAALPGPLSGKATQWLGVIACGGRDYKDERAVRLVLDAIDRNRHLVRLIEGDARGADRLAGDWARRHPAIRHTTEPADWERDGRKRAGPIRNGRMRDLLVQMREQTGCKAGVVAFPGGDGTANMIEQAARSGIRTLHATDMLAKIDPANYGARETRIVWMATSREAFARQAFHAGPTPDRGSLADGMLDGELLVGKRAGKAEPEIVSLEIMRDGKLEPWTPAADKDTPAAARDAPEP